MKKLLSVKFLKSYNDFSEILLITNPQSLIDIIITPSNEYAMAKGDNQKLKLDLLEKKAIASKEDVCVTSALEGNTKEAFL